MVVQYIDSVEEKNIKLRERILKTIKQQIGPDRIVYLFGCLIVFKTRSQIANFRAWYRFLN